MILRKNLEEVKIIYNFAATITNNNNMTAIIYKTIEEKRLARKLMRERKAQLVEELKKKLKQ